MFDLGSVQLQSGIAFPNAKLAYNTYGALAPDKSNVIVMPSYYNGTHKDVEWLIAVDKILDPSTVTPVEFGSPSGIPVLLENRLTIDVKVGGLGLISPFVEFGSPSGECHCWRRR